jgi:hypothetical protein
MLPLRPFLGNRHNRPWITRASPAATLEMSLTTGFLLLHNRTGGTLFDQICLIIAISA